MPFWNRKQDIKGLRKPKTPWLFRLPKPFQVNSSLAFLAIFFFLVGVAALFGLSEPSAITKQMTLPFYKMWGAGLALASFGLLWGIYGRDLLIEKLSARMLGIQLACFGAWSIAAVGIERAIVTASLIAVVNFFLEQRICYIKVILDAQHMVQERGESEGGGSDYDSR